MSTGLYQGCAKFTSWILGVCLNLSSMHISMLRDESLQQQMHLDT